MKKFFVALLCLAFCCSSHAQQFLNKYLQGSGSSDSLIINIVKRAVYVCEHSFQIQDDNGELFGLDNKEEFGIVYSLGIKVKGGAVLSDKAIHPWRYYTKFEKYKNDYKPIISQTRYSEIGEKAEYIPIKYKTNTKRQENNPTYLCDTESFGYNGFLTDNVCNNVSGWLIWARINKTADISKSANIDLVVSNESYNTSSDINVKMETNTEDKEILGGLFVIPDYSNLGCVNFKLCGVIVEDSNKEWRLCFPFTGQKKESTITKSSDKETDVSNLTPVKTKGKKESRKKNKK